VQKRLSRFCLAVSEANCTGVRGKKNAPISGYFPPCPVRINHTKDEYQEVEHAFICPYCWEPITMLLDLSVRRQSYVEDCEVCCNPIEVSYTVEDGMLASFEAERLE